MTEERRRPVDWKELPEVDEGIARLLLEWFEEHGRTFPWRTTSHPYRLLCTEIMLQRTRAEQVAQVFDDYVVHWDGPMDVLALGEDKIQEIFGQLGLLWRAEYFWRLQEELAARHGGEVPRDSKELEDLPGVGPYVATAVRVFAFGKEETVVDSNVLRILGRFYGVEFPDHARRSRRVLQWASRHAPKGEARTRKFNWALIDFGALVCTPRDPVDPDCPLREGCWRALAG